MSMTPYRRLPSLLAAVVAGLFSLLILPGPGASAAVPRDTVTVGGYHYYSERPADVIAGTSGNNLVFRYVAASPLTDGTLVIDLPTSDWPVPLFATGVFTGDPSENGGVVVRPGPAFPAGPGDCTGTATSDIDWTVVNATDVHRIVVQHLTCATGQQIAVRIYGIEAPSAVGKYSFPVSVSDAAGAHRTTPPRLRVVPPPRIRLEVTVAAAPEAGTPVSVVLRALKPNGRVDTSYRGGVALLSEDRHDCTFEGYEDKVYDFTAADAGVHIFAVTFTYNASHRLEAYDVANRALPGQSNPYQVVGELGLIDCPVSYH